MKKSWQNSEGFCGRRMLRDKKDMVTGNVSTAETRSTLEVCRNLLCHRRVL